MISKIGNTVKKLMNFKVNSDCGHSTHVKGKLKSFKASFDGGEETTTEISLKLNKNGEATHCLTCIEEASIRCNWCGGTIMPGEPITLYSPAKDDFTPPEYAVEYNPDNRDKSAYVGCLRWDCAETGADMCGHWGFDKQIHRVKSPYQQALETGEPVIVNL